MAYEFRLPDIGEGVAEAEITKWLVAAGDTVAEDQPLVEVLTDKATVEIPSPRAGRIARLGAEQGAIVPVGSVLVVIDVAGEASAPPAPVAHVAAVHAGATTPTVTTQTPPAVGVRVEAVPAARMLAKDRGLDLATVTGTGPNGRITLEDVKKTLEATTLPGKSSAPSAGAEERVPLRGLRRKIADHMAQTWSKVPQFTFVAECDMTAVVHAREAAKQGARESGAKLTYLAYVVRAVVESLPEFPLLNASLDEAAGEIVMKKHYDIGIATATEDGLVVPVIRGADRHELVDLAKEIERLAHGARDRKLGLEELTGGTFTITTTGAFGGLLATPIVHHPQVAILGVHAVTPKPVVRDGQIVIREITNLSLSLDHRVVDGDVGARFLYDVIARLERAEVPGR